MSEEERKKEQNFKVSDSSVSDSQIAGQAKNDLYANQIQGSSNNIIQIIQNIFRDQYSANTQRARNEMRLLQQVRAEVSYRLNQSLYKRILINPDINLDPEQVKRPWDSEIRVANKIKSSVSNNMTIVDVFDEVDIDGKLLILGVPGTGKTTKMLELAKILVERAETDISYPIPILFNLSSWKSDDQLINDWLVEELSLKYGVTSNLGKAWLNNHHLIPLLDGLDEVKPIFQELCILQINNFLESELRPVHLITCSRSEEYQYFDSKLVLSNSISLKPLDYFQIRTYLINTNKEELWKAIKFDDNTLDLVGRPLFLSICILADQELSVRELMDAQDDYSFIEIVLDAYIRRMLKKNVGQGKYHRIKYWLIWLARYLEQQSQSYFLLDNLQPEQVLNSPRMRIYRLLLSLSWGVIGVLILEIGLALTGKTVNAPIIEWTTLVFGQLFGRPVGQMMSGFVCGLIIFVAYDFPYFFLGRPSSLNIIRPVEALEFSYENIIHFFDQIHKALISSLFLGLMIGLIIGFLVGVFIGILLLFKIPTAGHNPFSIFLMCSTITPLGTAFLALLMRLYENFKVDVFIRKEPIQGIKRSAKLSVICIFFMSILSLIIYNYMSPVMSAKIGDVNAKNLLDGIAIMLIFLPPLVLGGIPAMQHLALRLTLFGSGDIPWNYTRFLDDCTEYLILQRIGGRYKFIHALLQDHFMSMPFGNK